MLSIIVITIAIFGTPGLVGGYPEHLVWRIIEAWQFQLGTMFFGPFAIDSVGLFAAAIISNVFTLRLDAIQL